MGWSTSAPSGVSFNSTTKKTGSHTWNTYRADPINVWTARGTGDTYYVKVTVRWREGQNGYYQKKSTGIWWAVGSDKENFDMPDSATNQTRYYTGTRSASGTRNIHISPNENLSDDGEVETATIPAAKYTVTYNGNGATSGSTAAQTHTYGTVFTTAANGFVRAGYKFTGWNTAANGSGTAYAASTAYISFPDRAITLYAQWAVSYQLGLSSDRVSTPGSQVITIANGGGKTASVTVKRNSTTLFAGTTASGSITAQVTKAWFETAGVTTASSFTATATAVIDGVTLTKTFTVAAGSDMAPVIGTPTITPVNAEPAATYYPDKFITGVSRLKAEVAVTAPTSADISAVTLTVGSENVAMTLNPVTGKYEGTTTGAITANTGYSITAVDERGLSTSLPADIVGILAYSPPVATVDQSHTYRCESDGTPKITGAWYRAMATATFTQLTGNSLLAFSVKLQGEQTATALTPGVQSGVLGGTMSQGQSYTLVFTIQDKVSVPKEYTYILKAPAKAVTIHHDSGGTAVDLPEGGMYKISGTGLDQLVPDWLKLTVFTLLNAAGANAGTVNTYSSRKLSDYDVLIANWVVSNSVRATAVLWSSLMTPPTSAKLSLFYVDSVNDQRWCEISYISDTSLSLSCSSNASGNVYLFGLKSVSA